MIITFCEEEKKITIKRTSDNRFIQETELNEIIEFISDKQQIVSLEIYNITSVCISDFFERIALKNSLINLKLINCVFEPEYFVHIVKLLEAGLKKLKIWYNCFAYNIDTLLTCLGDNLLLESLSLRHANLQDNGLIHIVNMLKNNSSIHTVDLYDNFISCKGVAQIVNILRSNKTVRKLNLGRNTFKTEGAIEIAKMLQSNNTLHTVYIHRNGIESNAGTHIADMLKINKGLKKLHMYGNKFGSGSSEIFKALMINDTLTDIDLECNRIGCNVENLIEMIKINKTVKSVNVNNNMIGSKLCIEIAKALQINSTITDFFMFNGNNCGDYTSEIVGLLEENYSIIKSDVIHNNDNNNDLNSIMLRNKKYAEERRFVNTKPVHL